MLAVDAKLPVQCVVHTILGDSERDFCSKHRVELGENATARGPLIKKKTVVGSYVWKIFFEGFPIRWSHRGLEGGMGGVEGGT